MHLSVKQILTSSPFNICKTGGPMYRGCSQAIHLHPIPINFFKKTDMIGFTYVSAMCLYKAVVTINSGCIPLKLNLKNVTFPTIVYPRLRAVGRKWARLGPEYYQAYEEREKHLMNCLSLKHKSQRALRNVPSL